MHTITYELNGQKHAFDGDSVFTHNATGKMFLRGGDGLLRDMSPDEIAALKESKKAAKK